MAGSVLGGFVDSLLQGFENCRTALTDEQLAGGEGPVQAFFTQRYEKEALRLRDTVRLQEPMLSRPRTDALWKELDDLARRVLVPAYSRLALRFTPRERNDFYLAPEHLRTAERVAFAVAGLLIGLFIVWAPFIPLWSKEWVLVFLLGGLFAPTLRRTLALKRYEREINRLVAATEREVERLNSAYLLAEDEAPAELPAASQPAAPARAPLGERQKEEA